MNKTLCKYGCGQEAKFTLKNGAPCCSQYCTQCPVNKKRNREAILASAKHKARDYKTSYQNFPQESKDRMRAAGRNKEAHQKAAQTLRERIALGIVARPIGKAKTPEAELARHDRISKARIAYLERCPHIPWKVLSNGLKVQGDWEYNVGEELLKRGCSLDRPVLRYDTYRRYTPDFHLIGTNVYIEVKGWLRDRDIRKYKRVQIAHPDKKIYLIEKKEYKKFIAGELALEDCRDLYETINAADVAERSTRVP